MAEKWESTPWRKSKNSRRKVVGGHWEKLCSWCGVSEAKMTGERTVRAV